MTDFNIKTALDFLNDVLPLIEKAAHVTAGLDIPGLSPAASIAEVAAQVAANVAQRVEDGVLAASTDDLATLKALREKIAAANDDIDRQLDVMNASGPG